MDAGPLDETSPLVQATLDRLALTQAVLQDGLDNPQAATATATGLARPARPGRPGAGAGARAGGDRHTGAPHPARARPRTHDPPHRRLPERHLPPDRHGTAGRRPVARPVRLTLRAGARRTIVLRLNAAGRRQLARHGRLGVTVKVALAGRPLSVARVTVR